MAERLIPLAVLLGLGLGLWQALGLPSPAAGPPDGAAALVNGRPIAEAEWRRAVEAIARDKRAPMTAADRQRALDNLISEELLVQQARAIGLLESDRGVRKALVDAMLQFIKAGTESTVPDEAALRALYRDRPELGQIPAQYRLSHARLETDPAPMVAALRNGQSFAEVFAGPLSASTLPAGWLSRRSLSAYLPPSLLSLLEQAGPGEILGPVTIDSRAHFLWVQDRQPASRPDFDTLRPQLESLWQREAAERAVADYLQRLRADAEIRQVLLQDASR